MEKTVIADEYLRLVADEVQLKLRQVEKTIELLSDGATIPFIARYRKELTGSLDEVQIAAIQQAFQKMVALKKRKQFVLETIDGQGKLTDSLKQRIEQCFDPVAIEDLYLPYKKKRKTRASVAKANGLEPLAQEILKQAGALRNNAIAQYFNEQIKNREDALQGARDIIAEWVSEDERTRNAVRRIFKKEAIIRSKVARGKEEEGSKYKDYFDFEEPLKNCPSHRLLAMRRGEEEGILRLRIAPDEEEVFYQLEQYWVKGTHETALEVKTAINDSYKRLLGPSIETEFRNQAKEKADQEAIAVFAENLNQLLLAPPLGQKRVLGIDPGYRTGCKVVCLDKDGALLHHDAIFPHPPQSKTTAAQEKIYHLVQHYQIEAIAIGNGTASRETNTFCKQIKFDQPIEIFVVNESGASIYSASEIAREEFPDHDVTVRGAISIGRRLMDPLAELVKIDAKSIGVGQYQHDVNQTQLKERLDQIVESCVNAVGVNLNTASKHLLTYVSGLGPTLAQNIIKQRRSIGGFRSRKQLLEVPRMGAKAFEQCAGFLRIRQANQPLDNTAVHPESYHVVEQMAVDLGCDVRDLIQDAKKRKAIRLEKYITKDIGMPTLRDIMKELEKPGLDPRGHAKAFEFANHVQTINDLQPGMVLPGIVNNITNFGAFVDIGIKESGLVHISQLANRFVKNPADIVKLNQEVQVRVVEIDLKRKRVQLSMKDL